MDKCFPSQSPRQHFKANGRMAWDIVCTFGSGKPVSFDVIAPDFRNEKQIYVISAIYYSKDTWNTMDLTFGNKRWTIWHITPVKKLGDTVVTGQKIWHTNLSGITTGPHSHVELWIDGINVDYSTRSQVLENSRKWILDSTVKIWDPLYFTSYNMWDPAQNDSSPYIGASGHDLRSVKNPIALTSDVRKLYWIKFWDNVKLTWPCSGIYSVHDEKNIRFRTSCIREQWACNKWDIAIPKDSHNLACSWIYTLTKL